MIATFLFYLGLLAILYLAITSIPLARRVRRLKRELRMEKTRSLWGEARAGLFDLVRQDKIRMDSATFRVFYGLQTFVLRRPDAYDEISRKMGSVLNTFPHRVTMPDPYYVGWLSEQGEWPEEMKDVFYKMSHGTLSLMTAHAGLPRFLLFWAKVVPGAAVEGGLTRLDQVSRWLESFPGTQVDKSLVESAARMQEIHQGV